VRAARPPIAAGMRRGRAKFLRYFPMGFRDPLYEDWERSYKWTAHARWAESLAEATFRQLMKAEKHREIAAQAIAIEARTNLLFSFEKMALRDAANRCQEPELSRKGYMIFSMAKANWSTGSTVGERW
jgi:hypothetical protein